VNKLSVLDLFSGIGGFSLGLERTGGFETAAFCEIDPYCQKVLAKNFPGVPCHDDVRTYPLKEGDADVITAGFPCQDVSFAGTGAGLAGSRSGLYREVVRAVRVVRPLYAVLENVAALLGRGLGTVLGDLAEVGYDAEWHCIPAAAVGAPHRRDRIWIVANPGGEQHEGGGTPLAGALAEELSGIAADASAMFGTAPFRSEPDRDHARAGEMADADQPRLEGRDGGSLRQRAGECTTRTSSASVADAEGCGWPERVTDGRGRGEGTGTDQRTGSAGGGWWRAEPELGRVAHGIPRRVDRLKGLGNAVVPQIPELIGRAILAREAAA
jgi:DNA (cytosine-5)-methyltransferase 1